MTQSERHAHSQSFDNLRRQIDADPDRRARVEEHKTAMLAELRRSLDLTQAALAERLEVTQENVSRIERGEADVRLSTLSRYVEALGGRRKSGPPSPSVPSSSGSAGAVAFAAGGGGRTPRSQTYRRLPA